LAGELFQVTPAKLLQPWSILFNFSRMLGKHSLQISLPASKISGQVHGASVRIGDSTTSCRISGVHGLGHISDSSLSSLKVPVSAEGYCITAMTYFDKIQIEASMEGLQRLLLIRMYAMNNPSAGLNMWYLNYQCIAAVLELGLQRDVRAGNKVSPLTQR